MPKCVDVQAVFVGGGFPSARINHDTETREKSCQASSTVVEEGDMATFFSGPTRMIGATSSRENVSPPTTGPRKGNTDEVFP